MTSEQSTLDLRGLDSLNTTLMQLAFQKAEGSFFTLKEKNTLTRAATAYNTKNFQTAIFHYKTCISSINKIRTNNNQPSQMSVTVQYMLCKCLIQSQQFQNLMDARKILIDLAACVGELYPMIYYGLAELYVKLFCFDEAERFIAKAFSILQEDTILSNCYVPQTNDLILESAKEKLTEKLMSLKNECYGWHPPDAKCFMKICEELSPNNLCGRNIFTESLAYNGRVIVTCNDQVNPCKLTFHPACWKIQKERVSSGSKIPDKEIVFNWECLTPNCGDENEPSLIKRIAIYKEDGTVKLIDPPVEKLNRNTQQQSPASKGAIRKQKLMNKINAVKAFKGTSVLPNSNSNFSNNNSDGSNTNNSQGSISNSHTDVKASKRPPFFLPPPPPLAAMMKMCVLRSLNFNIDPENDWRPDEAYYGNEHMRSTIDSSYEPDFSNDPEHALVESAIFSYFVKYIGREGPIEDNELMKCWHEISEMIDVSGTILQDLNTVTDVKQFLLQSLKLVAVGNYMCLPAALPETYALLEQKTYHTITEFMKKSRFDVDKNEREKKKGKRINGDESDIESKEVETVEEIPREIELAEEETPSHQHEDDESSADDQLSFWPHGFIDICESDWIDSSSVHQSPIKDIGIENSSGKIGEDYKTDSEYSEENDENNGAKREMLQSEERRTSEEFTTDEAILHFEIEEIEKIETEKRSEIEVHQTAKQMQIQRIQEFIKAHSNDRLGKDWDISESIVIETESDENPGKIEDLLVDENLESQDSDNLLSPIEKGKDSVHFKNEEQEYSDTEDENYDGKSSGSSTIEEVMNIFRTMSNNYSHLPPTPKNNESSDGDIMATQTATITRLTKELQKIQDELEKTTNDLRDMKIKVLKKSLDAQYISKNIFISYKMEAMRSDYAIISRVQQILHKTCRSYLSIDPQQWLLSLDELDKLDSSLHDEYTKLRHLVDSRRDCEDIEDVHLNIPKLPALPHQDIPDLVETAFNMIKNHSHQSIGNSQPPMVLAQNSHIPLMMPTYYQQIPFFQQPLANGYPAMKPVIPSIPVQQPAVYLSPRAVGSTLRLPFKPGDTRSLGSIEVPQNITAVESTRAPQVSDLQEQAAKVSSSGSTPISSNQRQSTLMHPQDGIPQVIMYDSSHLLKNSSSSTQSRAEIHSKDTDHTGACSLSLGGNQSMDPHVEVTPTKPLEIESHGLSSGQKISAEMDVKFRPVTCNIKPTDSVSCAEKGNSKEEKQPVTKIQSADKLMHLLRKKYPGILEYDLLQSLLTIRKNHNNRLSGLLFSQITKEMDKLIKEKESLQLTQYIPNNKPTNGNNQGLFMKTTPKRTTNDPISSTSSASSIYKEHPTKMDPWNKLQDVSWKKKSPERECIICMEVLTSLSNDRLYTLQCQHTFHKRCIKNWFTYSRSCPTCRIHSTIDDEFPPLP